MRVTFPVVKCIPTAGLKGAVGLETPVRVVSEKQHM